MKIPFQDQIASFLRFCTDHSLTHRGHIVQQSTHPLRQETEKGRDQSITTSFKGMPPVSKGSFASLCPPGFTTTQEHLYGGWKCTNT